MSVPTEHEPKAVAPARPVPTGTGYGHPQPTYRKDLVEVGAGTPMGEYMRRYWHPIAASDSLTELPRRARLFGEDLVLFRDKRGRAGCVFERCTHRQASLFYGRIEDEGIRCCYHGWLFDVEGRCLDQAVEEGGGKFRDKVRQPWYPVQEQYGLVFVYMGPPDKMPLLPRYDCMEGPAEDETYVTHFGSLPGGPEGPVPTNWLIDQDNIHDMGHALWLHQLHSGAQFGDMFNHVTKDTAAAYSNAYEYIETPRGIFSRADVPLPNGAIHTAMLETQMPNVRLVPPHTVLGKSFMINWILPIDDTSHINCTLARISPALMGELAKNPLPLSSRGDAEQQQRFPSDLEAQDSQGPIEYHSEEHLAYSDRGVIKLRRQYERQLKALAQGEPLMNLAYEPGTEVFETHAGALLKQPVPGP